MSLFSKSMIKFYPKYKQFKALVDAKDYENAVRSGLDFLRCCEVSKKLILDFVEEIEYNYAKSHRYAFPRNNSCRATDLRTRSMTYSRY